MAEPRPVLRPSDLRRAVSEWAAQGFQVKVDPDGTITVLPAAPQQAKADQFDMVDFKR